MSTSTIDMEENGECVNEEDIDLYLGVFRLTGFDQ